MSTVSGASSRSRVAEMVVAGDLRQFGKRCGDEVFTVLPYESWTPPSAEAAVSRAAEDPHTTTGDTRRALVTEWPPS